MFVGRQKLPKILQPAVESTMIRVGRSVITSSQAGRKQIKKKMVVLGPITCWILK